MKEPFYYTEGAEIEMFIDGKWTRGKVVNGYRFRDGLITMETAEGRRVWCGEASGAWREPDQRKILKKHARLFDLRLKPFESNEEIRDRILERINARF